MSQDDAAFREAGERHGVFKQADDLYKSDIDAATAAGEHEVAKAGEKDRKAHWTRHSGRGT